MSQVSAIYCVVDLRATAFDVFAKNSIFQTYAVSPIENSEYVMIAHFITIQ
jgi:hypothetical protein